MIEKMKEILSEEEDKINDEFIQETKSFKENQIQNQVDLQAPPPPLPGKIQFPK